MTSSRLAFALCLLLSGPAFAQDKAGASDTGKARRADAATEKQARSVDVEADPDSLRGLLLATDRLAGAEDFTAAAAMAAKAIGHAEFAALPAEARRQMQAHAGWLAWRGGDRITAHGHYRRATAFADSTAAEWEARAWLALELEWFDDAADSLRQVVLRAPGKVADIDNGLLWGIVNGTKADSEARYRLLLALRDADYAPRLLGDASTTWHLLALAQLERGDTEGARATVARITAPLELIKVLSDKRFDPVVDADAPQFDLVRAARRRVDDLRARAILDPGKLEIQAELAGAMLATGEHEDVVALAEEAVAAIEAAGEGHAPYDDADEHLPWLLNRQATALRRLGRGGEAEKVLARAAGLGEFGAPNVSQVLNLAHLQCSLGRPDEALATVAKVGRMSGYGRMVLVSVQLRAAVQKQDAAGASAALAYLHEHRGESGQIYFEALLDMGRMDEAAAQLIALLADPAEREHVLLDIQDLPEIAPLPADEVTYARWEALLERPDVIAAIDRVGHRREHAVHLPY